VNACVWKRQIFICDGIRWEQITTVDRSAVDFHHWEFLIVCWFDPQTAQLDDSLIRNPHPDAAREEMLFNVRFHVEEICASIVNLLFTRVRKLILGPVGQLEYELVLDQYVLQVVFGDGEVPERRLWK
jgi:hypothetical protein